MTSRVITSDPLAGDIKYPCIMICDLHAVLFVAPGCGTVVAILSKDSGARLGEYSANWNMARYHAFHGTVELSQE
jgi:hypothetical protein